MATSWVRFAHAWTVLRSKASSFGGQLRFPREPEDEGLVNFQAAMIARLTSYMS